MATSDNNAGPKSLLHLLATDIAKELKSDKIISAQQFAQKLHEHAQSISEMVGLIQKQALSDAGFMKFRESYLVDAHAISSNPSIDTLWKFSFGSLSPISYAILAIMSFLEPGNIPQELFMPKAPKHQPQSLQFSSDSATKFTEEAEQLLNLSLVKQDSTTGSFSLDRLVQAAFRKFMTPKQKQDAFRDATILVANAFPQRNTQVATLYLEWDRCAPYLKHVISLKECFRQEHASDSSFVATRLYCNLSNMCQRYLLELHNHAELQDLVAVNYLAIASLPQEQAVGLRASLTSHKGQSLVFVGKPEEGMEYLEQSYEIRRDDVPFDPRESAWAASNVAMGLATLNRFEEAIKWYNIAQDHFMGWAKEQTGQEWELPADVTCYGGSIYFWARQIETARTLISEAKRRAEAEQPFSWAVLAQVHFALGNVKRFDREYKEAEDHYMEAQNLCSEGGQMRSNPFGASCMYRLGCTALDRGDVQAAIKHLRDALAVTETRKATMVAEHARVLFKLSEALKQDPRRSEEAGRKREQAENLLKQLPSYAGDLSKESTYDRMVVMSPSVHDLPSNYRTSIFYHNSDVRNKEEIGGYHVLLTMTSTGILFTNKGSAYNSQGLSSLDPKTVPEHPTSAILNSLDRLKSKSLASSLLPSSPQSTKRSPTKRVVQGLANLGKKVLRPPKADTNKSPMYLLIVDKYGRIPLLTLERRRYLEPSQPMQNGPLIEARFKLQTFRANFTRDIPELKFHRGQAQVNIVVGYLMSPCSPDLEQSPTTQFVRHSHASLRAWKEYQEMSRSQSSRAHRRLNVVEARRRVRRNNKVIQDFNALWDTWVSEQKPEVQTAARRRQARDELHGEAGDLFRDLYHSMLVACDGEIEKRQDIAEALILQYPSSFPGFVTKPPNIQ
ncbi:hypothetical protein O1611_g1492 [Lasiodiplodia mahajangana]|uniref:Uncharacterized protein n=1 Tax=Lasiodiplodia mahajangana TaxID=1108764 RepID=A0ACC2JXE9_9PEZI|nr:hypothetical protein O1611_g1492 [Lasiodiplodia mahajangana]